MCLSIPAKVESIEDGIATCSVGESRYNTSLDLISNEDVKIGDYVLIHTGFAIQKLDTDEANSILSTFEEFKQLNEKMDQEETEQNKRLI
ncbi:MAG: HypC/HybG/HupF family hydrogenase formation chaperone [Bacteroidetes bacterium]|nr:HypC/HybG/HupF family hydrogenase formation chaperone [Bacteroidota bacterium]